MFKRLVSHTAIYGLASQVPRLAGILALYFTSPFLTEIDFAVSGIINSLVGAVSVFGILGLNIVLSNLFYKSPMQYKWGWRQIYGFLTLWNIPYSILLAACIYFIVPIEAQSNALMIITLNIIPLVLFGATSTLCSTYYQLSQKPLQIMFRSIVVGLIAVGLNIVFIAHYKMGYMGWFWSGAISQLMLQLSYWYPLNIRLGLKPIFNFKWRTIRKFLKVSLPTVPHYYGGYLLNSSDRLMMKILQVPIPQIGLYNAANTLSNPYLALGTASGQAIAPMMLQAYKKNNERQARNLVFILQTGFLLLCFITAIWSKEVITLLIRNKALQGVYPLAIILVMGYAYRPMYFGANFILFYNEKTKKLWRVSFIAGILTVVINIIFIPIWGYTVAAYSTFIGLMFMGYSGYWLKDFKERNKENYYPLFWFILTIGLTALALVVVEQSTIFKLLLSILLTILGSLYIFKLNKNV